MWVVYSVLIVLVVAAHILMFFVIKAGIRAAAKAEQESEPDAKTPSATHWSRGFQQPFDF